MRTKGKFHEGAKDSLAEKSSYKYKNQTTTNVATNEVGYLGKLFGLGKNAENNIAGLIAMTFALAITLKWVFCGMDPPNSFITLLSTIVAYLLAYRNGRCDR